MGLDTTHDCFHGAYSAFARWRNAVAEVAGYPLHPSGRYAAILDQLDVANVEGDWDTDPDDILLVLLNHSDCDGHIVNRHCAPLADRLEELLPMLFDHRERTEQFIAGLRVADRAGDAVGFH